MFSVPHLLKRSNINAARPTRHATRVPTLSRPSDTSHPTMKRASGTRGTDTSTLTQTKH